MNFSSLEYMIQLARDRNFTKAAQQLHITQQSLSAHIAALEEELGCKLFVRHVPLELTYAGEVFLRYAEHIQQELKNMRREFCDITDNQKGVLRIGIAFTRSRSIMPELILRFQRQYPNIEIELSETTNQGLHYALLNKEVDLAIANFADNLPGIELAEFYQEEIVLLLADSLLSQIAPHADKTALEQQIRCGDLSALKHSPFVLGNSEDIAGRIGRTLIDRSGFTPIVKTKSDNIETLLALCQQGAGACFCPLNFVSAAIPAEALAGMHLFSLGEQAKYPIRFGFLRANYQWKVISAFIRLSAEGKSEI